MLEYTQMLENENKKLVKSVQFLNDSTIKLQSENDALSKALLTCSVKRQELQEKLRVSEPYVMSAMSDQATINTLGEQITELQAENQALRETILGEVTTADDFNSEFRHNPDDDAPDAVSDEQTTVDDETSQCNVCGVVKSGVAVVWGEIDIITACQECLDSGKPLQNNFDS